MTKQKLKFVAILTLLVALPAVMQATIITDNFSDPSNWGTPIIGGGNLIVSNGRMNYTSSSTMNTTGGAAVARSAPPLLPIANDWSLQVDVHLDPFTLTTIGQFSDLFLGFGKTSDSGNTHMMLEFGRSYFGNPAHNGYYIHDDVRINGVQIANKLFENWNVTSSDISLRMDYSATSHTITYYYDADGAANGYNWIAQGTANLASGTYNLNLGPTDTLTIALTGSSGYQNVANSQAYFSNLVITLNQSPIVATGLGTTKDATSATVNGIVNPNGLATTAQFDYGLTTNYGNIASIVLSPSNGASAQTVSATLIGLQPGMTYHFRLSAFNNGGSGIGSDAAFHTLTETAIQAWVQRYNVTGNGEDYPRAVAVDTSNSVIVTGYSWNNNFPDYVTIKYSSTGVPLWTNRYDDPANGDSRPNAMALDSSNNVIVTGESGGYATIKYAITGVPLWTNRYNGTPDGMADLATSVAVDGSNNVIVTGCSYRVGTDSDYATIKYSSSGVPLWTNIYSGEGGSAFDGASAIIVDHSNNVIVTGSSYNSGTGSDYVTIKYSSAGTPLWVKRYDKPGNGSDGASTLAVDSSNNVIVMGNSTGGSYSVANNATIKYSSTGVPLWTNRYSGGANGSSAIAMAMDSNDNVFGVYSGDNSFMLIKYSSAGVRLWATNYSGWDYFYYHNAHSLTVDGNNNAIVTGGWSSRDGSYSECETIKYSSGGVQLWTNQYHGPSFTYDYGQAVAVDHNNNVIVAANSGGDYATIKYVNVPVPVLTSQKRTDGTFQIQVDGVLQPGTMIIEVSTNLAGWSPVFTNDTPTNVLLYTDPKVSNYIKRFYRASQSP